MATKITIQHLYTTGTTAAPAASALTLGEIAISAGKDKEGIYFKNNNNEVVKVLTSAQTQSMILETAGSVEGFNEHIGHKANNKPEYEGNNPYGHVKLVSGELSGYTSYGDYVDGEAAAAQHTHGQYFSFLDSGKGLTTIIGNEENGHPGEKGFAISDNTYAQITGATQTTTFNAHTGNTTVHITGEERTNWNNAANRINTFLDIETGATTALDSLHEIQEYLTGSGNSVNTLLESLNDLTDTVSGNTDSISDLNTDVTALKNEAPNYIKTLIGDDHIEVKKLSVATQPTALSHKPASTQTSAITATNTSTGLNFGDVFNFVDNVGYDKNGHVVSGTTKTLRLPTVPTATTAVYGIVKIQEGDLEIEKELINTYPGIAAGVKHSHSQYVKLTDLYSGNTSSNITISCGTY